MGSGFSLTRFDVLRHVACRRRSSARRARDSACAPGDRRQLGESTGALLARARGSRDGDRARLGGQHGRTPAARRAPLPHLARVHRELGLPRASRPCDADRAARPERRLRARDAVRARRRGRFRRRVLDRAQPGARAQRRPERAAPAGGALRAAGNLGRRLARRAATARRPARSGGARWLAARARRWRSRALRLRGVRLHTPLSTASRALRVRVHARVRAARGGDGRHRVGGELAALVVGVARPHARRVPRDRPSGALRVARGAVQPPLPRRDARGSEGCQRPPRGSRGLHPVLRGASAGARSRAC